MSEWDSLRDDLARRLKTLYEASPLVETAIARATGFSQSKVSRILTGRIPPSVEDVRVLTLALGGDGALADELAAVALRLVEERARVTPTRVILGGSTANHQRRIGRIEARSSRVAGYHPLLVPGLLQTAAYIRAVHRAGWSGPEPPAPRELSDFVESRTDRQQTMAEPGRSCAFVVPETALLWAMLPPAGMAEQIEHIATLIRSRPSWRIGVVPAARPPGDRPLYLLNGFSIFDDRAVLLGTTAGNALLTDADDIARHRDYFERLSALAVFGDEAEAVLGRTAQSYLRAGP